MSFARTTVASVTRTRCYTATLALCNNTWNSAW